jgi:hypothetical protein
LVGLGHRWGHDDDDWWVALGLGVQGQPVGQGSGFCLRQEVLQVRPFIGLQFEELAFYFIEVCIIDFNLFL